MQLYLFEVEQIKKRVHDVPSYIKTDKIKENLKEWNTIKHIYRYQTLYKICEILFLLTYNNQLACLNYYIDEEKVGDKMFTVMYAEIEETLNLSIKERVLKHINLLRQIKNGIQLEHDIKRVDSEIVTLFG